MKICLQFRHKGIRADNIQRGYAKQLVFAVNAGFFSTSAAIATVVFTGLVIIPTQACGQVLAIC